MVHVSYLLAVCLFLPHYLRSAVSRGLPNFACMGETALHMFACQGKINEIQLILPKCDADFILMESEFVLTRGIDALHSALVFQHENVAGAVLLRLAEIFKDPKYVGQNGLICLRKLLSVRDPCTGTTSVMLMCRCDPIVAGIQIVLFSLTIFVAELFFFRWGMDQLLERVTDLLKLVNNNSSRFPQMLEVTLFERDRSGMTALHHAVRSGSRLTVRWCMNNGAIACPHRNSDKYSHPKQLKLEKNDVNLKSFVADGSSNLTQATLWECVMCFIVPIHFFSYLHRFSFAGIELGD